MATEPADAHGEPPALRTYRVPWAALLQKVFDVDVLACPQCGGRLRLIAFIAEPAVARKSPPGEPDHLRTGSAPPPAAASVVARRGTSPPWAGSQEEGDTVCAAAARFVVFGEALTDLFREEDGRWRAVPGGSCWNVARAAARLGVPTGYAGAVSRDLFGDEHLRLSREAGLDLRFTQQVARAPLLAFVVSRDPPRYFFVGDDSADLHLDVAALPEGWLEEAEIVHFGSISLVRQPHGARLVATAERAHAAGKRISYDPNFRDLMDGRYRTTLARMAGLADYIKVSDEDLAGLFPGVSAAGALGELRRLAPRAWTLFTQGAIGMRLLTPEREVFQPAFPVNVVDTVGAGDASMAGWIASVLGDPGAPLERHAAFAAAAAAVACGRCGAYAPTRGEVERMMAG